MYVPTTTKKQIADECLLRTRTTPSQRLEAHLGVTINGVYSGATPASISLDLQPPNMTDYMRRRPAASLSLAGHNNDE